MRAAIPAASSGVSTVEVANYARKSFTLPATDADTTATSANGTTFQSVSGVQTLAVGLPVGWSFDLGGHLALETVGVVHLGVLHTSYTSGENLVYGRGAPLDLFSNDLYDLYGDAEAKVRLAWRLESGLEFLASAGYFYGVSLSGTSRDAVTYYQGSANAQAGSYSEKVGYRLSGARAAASALGYSFWTNPPATRSRLPGPSPAVLQAASGSTDWSSSCRRAGAGDDDAGIGSAPSRNSQSSALICTPVDLYQCPMPSTRLGDTLARSKKASATSWRNTQGEVPKPSKGRQLPAGGMRRCRRPRSCRTPPCWCSRAAGRPRSGRRWCRRPGAGVGHG